MNPQTLQGIFGALSPGDMLKALAHVGVRVDAQGGGYSPVSMPMASIEEQMAPWNQTLVQVPATARKPIVNTAQLVEQPQPGGMLGPDPISAMSGSDVTPWAAAVAG